MTKIEKRRKEKALSRKQLAEMGEIQRRAF